MRQLDHPNIIKLVDFSESKQYYYIILELAPGGELFHQIVRLTYFSEDLSRHVITQVAEALEYLHEEKGVVHRYVATLVSHTIEYKLTPVTEILSQKTSSSSQYPSSPPKTQSRRDQTKKTKSTKANSSQVLVPVESDKSRSPISASPRSYGIPRP